MKIVQWYQKFIDRLKSAIVSDELRRRLLFCILNIALSATSFVMTVVNYFTGEHLLLVATLLFSLLCLLNVVVLFRVKFLEKMIYFIFGVESMALLLFFFISGIPNGFSALWICLIPSFALFIMGLKLGCAFSFLAFCMMAFLFWLPVGQSFLRYDYTEEFMLRLPFMYLSVFLISLLIEMVRRETQKQLVEAKQQYWYLYRHDALTGLYNRYGITEHLNRVFAAESRNSVSVILLDIDNFKSINDQYGHECGDAVLKAVASIPPRIMCKHCHCCRWGGEEFLLVMQCDHDATDVAEKIRQEISQTPILFGSHELFVTVSAGICIVNDLSDITIHDIIGVADKALYKSKTNGKNAVTTLYLPQLPKESPLFAETERAYEIANADL